MEKRLLTYQSELKQVARVPSNETRPPLNRSKTYNDKKSYNSAATNNNGNNKSNRYNNNNNNNKQYTNDNNTRIRRGMSNQSENSTAVESVGDASEVGNNDCSNNEQQSVQINKPKRNRRSNEKAELNNEDDLDENSIKNNTKKKQSNLNHLLNFKFLKQEPSYVYERDFKGSKSFKSVSSSSSMMFTKEMFLQANCQFLVNDDGDYNVHFKNPDTLVDWCKIEEVLLRSHQQITCPICLYPPIAAKITKCGHIYCWSCILNYLALGEFKWRKCPICFESIYKDDLKSVRISTINEYKIGDKIELNLMFKEKSSTLIYPVNLFKLYESNKPSCLNDLSKLHDYDSCKKYLKLQSIDQPYINEEIIRRENNELQNQLDTEVCEESVKCYINEAFRLLENRKKGLKEQSCPPTPVEKPQKKKVEAENVVKTSPTNVSVHYKDAFDLIEEDVIVHNEVNDNDEPIEVDIEPECEVSETPEQQQPQCNINEEAKSPNATATNNNGAYSYFYQAEDGQRIYMNSLNLRCLVHEYNNIESCPLKIEAKIVAIENMFMNNDLRKRFRYLAHIPSHSEFQIVELDLKEPIISAATLEKFKDQIDLKEKARKDKEEREKRQERRNFLRMNTFPANDFSYSHVDYDDYENIHDYNQEFPNINPLATTQSISINSQQQQQPQLQTLTSTSSSCNSEQASSVNETTQNQMSFAQMLKIESSKAKAEEWPSLATGSVENQNQNKTFSMSFSQRLTENKTKQTTSPTKTSNQLQTDEFEVESLPAPTFQRSFMFAIDTAFQNLELNSNDNADGGNAKSKKSGNKKQKKTKNLLFST